MSFNVTFNGFSRLDKRTNVQTASEVVTAGGQRWIIEFYPGGNRKALPEMGPGKGRVGFYLRWVPPDETTTLDAAFSLRLRGQQEEGPRFDVEWSCGMQFVHPSRYAPTQGQATVWGAHLISQDVLGLFVDQAKDQVVVTASITIFQVKQNPPQDSSVSASLARLNGFFWRKPEDVRSEMHVGQVVVPVWRTWTERQELFRRGVYPGVDFRIMEIYDEQGQPAFRNTPNATLAIRPLYPLIPRLEREWPLQVSDARPSALLPSCSHIKLNRQTNPIGARKHRTDVSHSRHVQYSSRWGGGNRRRCWGHSSSDLLPTDLLLFHSQ